ncbi:MAG TPA: hypothetical protein VE733_10030 [Streptosporangiaceae bacterium]|jgi:hypothetical protein|nr:hypothetical protein [Streptosporangiaceae bacterium]
MPPLRDLVSTCCCTGSAGSVLPALAYFRSPRPLGSWVIGLVAVLDSAALYLALCPSGAPSQAQVP